MGDHYTEHMYIAKGNEVGLKYLGPLPARVTDKTYWQCKHCPRKHFKTYRALCLRPNGCRCQSATTLGRPKYEEAAVRQNISFVPTNNVLPPNSKTKTQWLGPSGVIVDATYHEVAYKMPKRVATALGLYSPEPAAVAIRKRRKPSELRDLPPQPKGRPVKEDKPKRKKNVNAAHAGKTTAASV